MNGKLKLIFRKEWWLSKAMKSSLRTVGLPTEFVLWNYTQPVLQTTGKWVKYRYACWKNINMHINLVQIKKLIKLYKMTPVHKMFCFFL